MEIYKSLKEIARIKGINRRTCKALIGSQIFEVTKKGKRVGYMLIDDMFLLITEVRRGQNK